ncbi:hypothetical protein Tco_0775856 [Tanacetum coccineum]
MIINSTTMAVLESCAKHNMVAYLEKTDGNTDFHEIIDFLTRSSIHYALTASIRSDLLFDDVDGIDSLNNQAIFDAIQLMSSKSTSWDQIPSNIATTLKNVPVPLDHFPINDLTGKVFSFMVKKGKHFSGNVIRLFASMLVPPIEDEGAASERESEPQPTPSPPHPSTDQHEPQPDPSPRTSPTIHIPDSIPEGFGGNHEAQAKEIKALKAQVKKLKKGVKPLITHHKAWMKTRLARKTSLNKKGVHKEYVSKQGWKSIKTFKGEPSVHKDPAFDDLDDFVDVDDTLDYKETEDVQNEERNEGTDKGNESTDKGNESTDKGNESTDKGNKAPPPTPTIPTPTIFGNDETIAQVLTIMSQNKEKLKEKEKGVELRDVEETERPRPTLTRSILTLRPLLKIDPKDKGKKRIEEEDESDAESEGITEAKKKFKQLANDEEVTRKARLNADKILAEKLQEEERERFLYEKIKRSDDSFIAIGSAEDEKVIEEMNEQAADASKKRVKKDDSVKEEIKEEEGTRKRKLGTRKKMKSKKRKFTSKDDEKLRLCLTIAPNEDKEVDYEILDKKYPIIEWRSEFLTTKPYSSGVHTIMTDEGLVIHMLVENKYPLTKGVLSQLLELKLETEKDSIMTLELIRFVKKQIVELESEDFDGDEKDL